MRRTVIILGAIALAAAPALAAPAAPRLNAEQAQQIIGGCAAHAKAKKQSHAIAVTDGGGHLIAFWRMDGNTAGVGAFSIDKAKAVSLWGFPTSRMGAAADETPGFASAPGIVTVAGGVPIYSADGETHLGGVGVSGEAPEDDAACAVAGIEAAGLRAERVRSPTGGR